MISFGSGSFIVNPNSRRSDPNFSFHIWNMRLYGLQTSVMNSHISNSEPLKIIKYAWLYLRAASFLARGPQIPPPLALLNPIPPPLSLPYYASRRTVSVCPGSPYHKTILANLRPRYSIAAPVRVCPPLVDSQEGRYANLLEQPIYFYHHSFRSRSLRFFKLGIPEHWGNCIPVSAFKCAPLLTHTVCVTHTLV